MINYYWINKVNLMKQIIKSKYYINKYKYQINNYKINKIIN